MKGGESPKKEGGQQLDCPRGGGEDNPKGMLRTDEEDGRITEPNRLQRMVTFAGEETHREFKKR